MASGGEKKRKSGKKGKKAKEIESKMRNEMMQQMGADGASIIGDNSLEMHSQ